jgi:ribonuclease-3
MEPLLEGVKERIIQRAEIYDPKSRLQEWAQAEGLGTPHYATVSTSGPDHAKVFEVEVCIKSEPHGRGKGPNKQVAEQIAAQTALESLGISK